MNNQNTGGPAFPCDRIGGDTVTTSTGITMRDYFAAKAMQGLIANPAYNAESHERAAQEAYAQADAMIKARQA